MDQFKLGMQVGEIKAWCEAAKNEAKEMSLSAPFKPEEYETILPYMKEYAERNDISFYHERVLILTDLFGDMDLSGIWVFIIYKSPETLERYLKLKKDKVKLLEAGSYEGEAKRDIAVRFGRLLGYSDPMINERWN
ncbi:hypothetical protein H8D76_02460 [Candidatus Bathyarchaeota archaeon]|nr:hypothetical protein [Candidatus Bathyarchaeota archaeon]